MPTRRKVHFPVELPRTPCTPEMYKRILEIADKQGISIAEVQRTAFSLFLSQTDSKSVNIDREPVEALKN